jgi:hypothetical protein
LKATCLWTERMQKPRSSRKDWTAYWTTVKIILNSTNTCGWIQIIVCLAGKSAPAGTEKPAKGRTEPLKTA